MITPAPIATAKLGLLHTAPITDEDLVWVVRGTSGEGFSKSGGRGTLDEWRVEVRALVSCFVQRWLYLRTTAPAWRGKALGDLAQGHSVPISPAWLPGGAAYERWKGRDIQTTPERVAARIRRRAAALDTFDAELVSMTRAMLTGAAPLIESGHEWGAVSLYDGEYGMQIGTTEQRDTTGDRAVVARETGRTARRQQPVRYVKIPGQAKFGNVFSTYADASYGTIGERSSSSGTALKILGVAVVGGVVAKVAGIA